MKGKKKTILLMAAFILLIAISAFLYNNLKDQAVSPIVVEEEQSGIQSEEDEIQTEEEEKTKAPDFTVYDVDGNEVKLSDMEGTPVVLNFWASWCPPCKSEMPHFDTVATELGSEVQFMMVDLVDGSRETVETGADYIAQQGYGFPVFYDTSGEAGNTYGIRSIPTTVFIDKDGYIITSAQGAIDETALRQNIDMIR